MSYDAAEVIRILHAPLHISAVLNMMKTAGSKDIPQAEQRKNIQASLEKIKPKTKSEEQAQALAGAPWTTGKMVRRGIIGSVGGIGAGTLSGTITGSPITRSQALRDAVTKGSGEKITRAALKRMIASGEITKAMQRTAKATALTSPYRLAAGAVTGATFGLLTPLLQQKVDLEAARRGKF
jgi:hypothetical protein